MKKVIIIISLIFVALMAWILYLVLAVGTLKITVTPGPATITIDGKEYKDRNELNIKLRAKKHTLKITKQDYKDFSETVDILLWQTKTLNISLELTEESKELKKTREDTEKAARLVTEAWINYSDARSDQFLAQVKPYLSDDAYNSLTTSIKSSKMPNSQGLTMDLPHVFAPIKEVVFSSLEKENALLEVTTTVKESDINSIKSLDLELQKTQGKWMVTNIKYNYFNE